MPTSTQANNIRSFKHRLQRKYATARQSQKQQINTKQSSPLEADCQKNDQRCQLLQRRSFVDGDYFFENSILFEYFFVLWERLCHCRCHWGDRVRSQRRWGIDSGLPCLNVQLTAGDAQSARKVSYYCYNCYFASNK